MQLRGFDVNWKDLRMLATGGAAFTELVLVDVLVPRGTNLRIADDLCL